MDSFKSVFNRFLNKDKKPGKNEAMASGFEKYKLWCKKLLDDFEKNFDPKDKTKTQDIYNQAKRLYKITEGSGFELAFTDGIFGNSHSALGEIPRKYLSRRNQNAQALGTQIKTWLVGIGQSVRAIEEVVDKQVLESENGTILPIKSEHKEGFGPNDYPFTRNYIDQLRANNERGEDYAATLRSVKDTQSIIRKEDLKAVSGVYRSVRLDQNFWQSFYEDVMSTDPQVYNTSFLNNLNEVRFDYLAQICDTYERAYSKDGQSSSDKGKAWMLGQTDNENFEASLDEDKVPELNIPENFIEQKTFFAVLGVSPKDLIGKTEREIKKLLRTKYYNLAKTCHPDLYPNDKVKEGEAKVLNEAYETLIDPLKRAKYIKYGT